MEAGHLVEWRKKQATPPAGGYYADVEPQKGLIRIEFFDEDARKKLLLKRREKVP